MWINRILCSFIIASIVHMGCQPEPPNDVNTSCKILRGYTYYAGSIIIDSAEYIYSGNRITKVNLNADYYFTLDYNNNRIVKRNFFASATNASEGYDLVSYNADGTISKIERFDPAVSAQVWKSVVFHYSQGKLARVVLSEDIGTGNPLVQLESLYTYSGNNINKIVNKYYSFGQHDDTDSTLLVYDTQPNYFQKQNEYYVMTDPFFIDFDPGFLLFVLGPNNVIKTVNPTDPNDFISYTYTTDSRGNLASMSQDGEMGLRYTYNCP